MQHQTEEPTDTLQYLLLFLLCFFKIQIILNVSITIIIARTTEPPIIDILVTPSSDEEVPPSTLSVPKKVNL